MSNFVSRATQSAAAAAHSAASKAGAPKASASAVAAVAPKHFNQNLLLYRVDIALICVAGLFILLALPRAVARFSRLSAWAEGSFFRRVAIASPLFFSGARSFSFDPKFYPSGSDESVDVEKNVGVSDVVTASRTESRSDTAVNWSSSVSVNGEGGNPPTYMPSWSSMFPWAYVILSTKLRPGYSLGKCLFLLAYLAVMFFASLIDVDLFTSPSRLGYLATAQLPFIFMLATKNNVVGALIGMGYEKLNVFHRFAARFAVFAVNAHALMYFSKWSQTGTIASHMEPYAIWGCIALGAMDILYLLSLTALRQTYYQLFYVSHVISAIVVLVAVPYHEPCSIPYIIAAGAIYGFDRLVRLIQTRITTAHLRPIPELGMTRIEVPNINAGWRAGQHVRVKVLSTGMGILGWAESHPFTIASVSKSRGQEGLVLMVKKAGDWTTRLFEVAQKSEYRETGSGGGKVRVVIQGPYGGPGHAIVTSFSGALLIAGGSGITYALSTMQEMIQKGAEGASRVRVVDFVWSLTDPTALAPMMPLFNALLAQAPSAAIELNISVSYTRALTSGDALKPFERLPPGITLTAGRPRLPRMLDSVIDRTCGLKGRDATGLTGVVVGVCGPMALGEEAGRVVRGVSGDRRKAVGGVELHEEIFGW